VSWALGRWAVRAGLLLVPLMAFSSKLAAQTPEDPGIALSTRPARAPTDLHVDWDEAFARAEHPADFTRILAAGPPEMWDAAVVGLLLEKERVSGLALPVVLQRLGALGPETRFRVSAALARHSRDPRAVPLVARWAFEPEPGDDPRLRELAEARFEDPEMRAALEGLRRGAPPSAPWPSPSPAAVEPRPKGRGRGVAWWHAVLLVVSGWLGFMIFLWGLRLLRLRRLVRGLPVSTARSLAVGQVAIQGEAQPLGGESLLHPHTGEVCLFYDGAARRGVSVRFCVVDRTGQVAVDPAGAALLSADGIMVPGERVHLIGEARRARPRLGERAGEVEVGAPAFPRSAFQRAAQLMVGSVMGGLFGRGSAGMLFTDPLRCFWIWDDLQATPFTTPRETVWLVGAFLLAGAWVLVFLAVAAALLGG